MSGLAGEIVSPGYPDNYPNNSVCEWTITGREGDRIRLTFTDFALEDSLNCQLDSLEVTVLSFTEYLATRSRAKCVLIFGSV